MVMRSTSSRVDDFIVVAVVGGIEALVVDVGG
jgi:hypothetical protein